MTEPTTCTVPVEFLRGVIALCSQRGFSPENIEAWDKSDKWVADLWRKAEQMLAIAKWGTPAPVGVQPVASKSHGAWDGIEDVLDMPDGTDLYTADQVLAMGRVPPGWQAVPLEATHEMIMASGPHIATPAIWRAMLAAAPSIKQGGQHGAE